MKTAVVTGGTQGIGLEIARVFAAAGYAVTVSGRQEASAELSSLIKSSGGKVEFFCADARKRSDQTRLAEHAFKKSGKLDVWINCAGISIWKPLGEVEEGFWSDVMETNAGGTLWGCQAAARAMTGSGGVIVNISSLAGKRGSANNSAYCASKFAVNGITQALAKELGPMKIRVNAVCPVYVETPMILESLALPNSPAGGGNVREYLNEFATSQAALKRLPLAQEVAKTCLFLASDDSSAITGQCINVDCGVLPQ